MYKAILIYFIGSFLIFFQNNAKFINEYWINKQMYIILIISIPASYCYVYSYGFFLEYYNSAWSSKFILLGLSYMSFPVLTYFLLNENPFNLKNLLCFLLSLIIILIQYKL